jgi:tRNA(Ile)-lysidine synthase
MPILPPQGRLFREFGLEAGARVLVGLSGGPDSLALTHALLRAGFSVRAAHFDHRLRPEASDEPQQVAALAADLGLDLAAGEGEVAAYAREEKLSIEEAGRMLRYRFLFAQAQSWGADAVAVAHNADDQAETVLMHLLRGAGLDGLSGMAPRSLPNPWSEAIPLVRPLLYTWRDEIEAYCAEHGLQPLLDPSNSEITFFRNRLRHELLPILANYNPQAKAHLAQSARLLAADQDLLESLTSAAWPGVLEGQSSDCLHLDRYALLEQPLALQRRLLRRAHAALRPDSRSGADFAAVERALALLAQDFSAPQDWLDDLFILSEGAAFWIAGWQAQLPRPWPQAPVEALPFEAPRVLALDGWQLSASETSPEGADLDNADGFQTWLDAELAGSELLLRRRQPGDRFQPLGMDGSLKLADFFINEKLPQRARDAWPLLCKGAEILWVPGFRPAHGYRLHADSRQALHLQLRQAAANRVE